MIDNNTLTELEAALGRILIGKPRVVEKDKKLSISAVQSEAGLGVGSIYH